MGFLTNLLNLVDNFLFQFKDGMMYVQLGPLNFIKLTVHVR